jgi:hypothetical protein
MNSANLTHVMRGPVASAIASNCSLVVGSTTYGAFLAAKVVFNECDITPRNGAVTDYFVAAQAMAANSEIIFNGGSVTHSANWNPAFTGTSVFLRCMGTKFNNFTLSVDTAGSYDHIFTGCRIGLVSATKGFYQTNATGATKQVLQVTGCRFSDPTAANTPLRKNVNNPTATVLQSNTFVATALHDFSAGVTAANNTNI